MTKATFTISQAQFDAAFNAGVSDAKHVESQTAFRDVLLPLSGVNTDSAVAAWAALRDAFIEGQAHELVNPESAAKRWTRLIDALDLTKPQSPAAVAKAAQRARAKAKGATPSKATVTSGADAAAAVAQSDKVVSESARMSACVELLRTMNPDALVKAQAALLALVETTVGDALL